MRALAALLLVALRAGARRLRPGRTASSRRPTSPAPAFGRDFALTDHTGKPRTLADFRGKVVVLFFGYTQCPDVCPTTLAELAEAMKTPGPDASRVQVLFVTVDPERDTPELLAHYVPAFDPSFLGLYGATTRRRRARRRNSRSSTRSSRAGRRRATRWIIRPARSFSIRRAGCASTSATGRARRSSRTTSASCCKRRG